MKTVGIYITTPPASDEARHFAFYKACGYNYLEYCDLGFSYRPDQLAAYYEELRRSVDAAQRAGFQVWILLLAGMKQWGGPGVRGDSGTFSALDKAQLAARLDRIEATIRAVPGADGFTFFAGDPGGDPEGRSTVEDCFAFCREVRSRVRSHAPTAKFQVNVWAIAEWSGFPSPFSVEFWRKQVVNTKATVEARDLLGKDSGIAFSLDNYYRSLTLACFDDAKEKPELYPTKATVAGLKRRGVGPVLGWPYFLVDECDDGFIAPNNVVTKGATGSEVRYLRGIADVGLALGLDGMVVNAAFPAAETLNAWAFAKFYREPRLSPERALDLWAGQIATRGTRSALAAALRCVENGSNWDNSLPAERRRPPLADAPSPTEAKALLAKVSLRTRPDLPLLEPPSVWLERLGRRADALARGEVGGVNPIVRSAKR